MAHHGECGSADLRAAGVSGHERAIIAAPSPDLDDVLRAPIRGARARPLLLPPSGELVRELLELRPAIGGNPPFVPEGRLHPVSDRLRLHDVPSSFERAIERRTGAPLYREESQQGATPFGAARRWSDDCDGVK